MTTPSILDMPIEIIALIIDMGAPRGKGEWKLWRRNRWRPVYYNLLLVNKDFNSRFKEVDILVPMVASYSARQFNRSCLKMIMKQLNMNYILLSPNHSYHRTEHLRITTSDIKENCKKKEPYNPTNKEIRQNIYSFIKENNISFIDIFRGTGRKSFFENW